MIIFVCTGNTCRSIMAESYATSVLNRPVESRGLFVTSNIVNDNAERIIEEFNLYNPTLPKQLEYNDTINNLILVMTRNHYKQVKQMNEEANVHVLSDYIGETGDISDPFGASLDTYRIVFQQLKEYIDEIKES